jgi:hypothetical protein
LSGNLRKTRNNSYLSPSVCHARPCGVGCAGSELRTLLIPGSPRALRFDCSLMLSSPSHACSSFGLRRAAVFVLCAQGEGGGGARGDRRRAAAGVGHERRSRAGRRRGRWRHAHRPAAFVVNITRIRRLSGCRARAPARRTCHNPNHPNKATRAWRPLQEESTRAPISRPASPALARPARPPPDSRGQMFHVSRPSGYMFSPSVLCVCKRVAVRGHHASRDVLVLYPAGCSPWACWLSFPFPRLSRLSSPPTRRKPRGSASARWPKRRWAACPAHRSRAKGSVRLLMAVLAVVPVGVL